MTSESSRRDSNLAESLPQAGRSGYELVRQLSGSPGMVLELLSLLLASLPQPTPNPDAT